jgi:hypothetical protein
MITEKWMGSACTENGRDEKCLKILIEESE